TITDMLFHIINHSTHHRGQISVDLRNNAIEPPVLDYAFYKR
ncbi:MAG: damage-inducible protein DinB, partial [Arenibacter sp.]|nr:damage-inducible protein DinB [Arenibacter sp.]